MSLFPRIDASAPARKDEKPATPAAKQAAPAVSGVLPIEYADFEKVQLRTAKIISAEKVAGADKLLKLDVEIGSERRQIVAGIALYYKPEDVVGRLVVVVANLKPARIRGVDSNGMLLAASTPDGKLRLITVDGETGSGCVVK